MDSAPGGKLPKSVDVIRDKLAKLQANAERAADIGPYAGGVQATDRIAVATFRDPGCAAAFQERWLKAGVHSQGERRFRRSAVFVDAEDRVRAVELLKPHLAQFPDRIRRPGRGYEASLFLTLVGLLSIIVVLVAVGNIDEQQSLTPAVAWDCVRITGAITLHLAFCGLFIDLVKSGKLNFGRGQFNLIFVLWLMTAAALVVYWR